MPPPSGSAQSWQAPGLLFVSYHLSRAHGQGVYQHAVTSPVPFMTSELWALSQDRESSRSMREPSSLCKHSVISTQRFCFSKQTKDKYLQAFPLPGRFPSLIFSKPWYSQLQGHLSNSATLFAILQLLTFFCQQHKTSLFSKASLILTCTWNRNLPSFLVNWKTSWISAAEPGSKTTGPRVAIMASQFKCW